MSRWKTWLRGCWQDRSRRAQLLAGFVVLAALGNLRMLRYARQYYAPNQPPDPSIAAGERFEPLRQQIPIGAITGYFGDSRRSSAEGEAAFNSARFALAPRMIVYAWDQELVVADFPYGEPQGLPPNLQLIADPGQGARLYRNTGAR